MGAVERKTGSPRHFTPGATHLCRRCSCLLSNNNYYSSNNNDDDDDDSDDRRNNNINNNEMAINVAVFSDALIFQSNSVIQG